jgi:pimeloyl-ACP methyl ester carboxylesterase
MKKPPLWAIALIITPLFLIGGLNALAPEISEQTVFLPQPRPAKATNQMQLDQFWLDNAKASKWRWAMDITTPEPGVTRLKSSDPSATFLAQDVRHGFLPAGNVTLAYSYFTRADAKPDATRPLIIECTGNAMDRYSAGVSYAQKALPWGDVLMFDYPGYGDSTGAPSAETLEPAITAVIAHARAAANGRKIILWGHSLGGFVCGKMASQMPETQALILETTARNARDVVREWTPNWMRPIVFPKISPTLADYDTAKAVGKAKFPILVMGAGQDKTLPVGLSRTLASALKDQGAIVTYHEFAQAEHWNVPKQNEFRGVMNTFFGTLR